MKSLMIPAFLLFFMTPSFAAEISEAEVKAFLETWLSAQNTGSFTDYTAMYAGTFFGVKRSGERTLRFNREKWLQDRKRMFRNKMTVAANNVQIATSSFSATIRFEQTYIDSDGFIEFLSRDPETRGVPHSFEFVPTGGGKNQERKFKGSYDFDCPC